MEGSQLCVLEMVTAILLITNKHQNLILNNNWQHYLLEITSIQESLKHCNYYGTTSICFVVNMEKRTPLTKEIKFCFKCISSKCSFLLLCFPQALWKRLWVAATKSYKALVSFLPVETLWSIRLMKEWSFLAKLISRLGDWVFQL